MDFYKKYEDNSPCNMAVEELNVDIKNNPDKSHKIIHVSTNTYELSGRERTTILVCWEGEIKELTK